MNQERILMRSPSESLALQREDYRKQKEKRRQREQMENLGAVRKRCFKCHQEKTLLEYYTHPQMADGRLNKCKECTKRDVTQRYADPNGRGKVREYERTRYGFQSRKQKQRIYQKRRRERYPEKDKARQAINNAIRDGKIVRLPCEVCGEVKSQAHHSDYSKPLSVQWLCFKHHREIAHGQKVGSTLPTP